MALQQTLPGVDNDELFNQAFNWEPKYSNRFIMYMNGTDIPSYLVKASARPTITNSEIILDHMNIDRKV